MGLQMAWHDYVIISLALESLVKGRFDRNIEIGLDNFIQFIAVFRSVRKNEMGTQKELINFLVDFISKERA